MADDNLNYNINTENSINANDALAIDCSSSNSNSASSSSCANAYLTTSSCIYNYNALNYKSCVLKQQQQNKLFQTTIHSTDFNNLNSSSSQVGVLFCADRIQQQQVGGNTNTNCPSFNTSSILKNTNTNNNLSNSNSNKSILKRRSSISSATSCSYESQNSSTSSSSSCASASQISKMNNCAANLRRTTTFHSTHQNSNLAEPNSTQYGSNLNQINESKRLVQINNPCIYGSFSTSTSNSHPQAQSKIICNSKTSNSIKAIQIDQTQLSKNLTSLK